MGRLAYFKSRIFSPREKKIECDFCHLFTACSTVHFRHLTHLLLIELEQKIINADIKDDHAMNDISALQQKTESSPCAKDKTKLKPFLLLLSNFPHLLSHRH